MYAIETAVANSYRCAEDCPQLICVLQQSIQPKDTSCSPHLKPCCDEMRMDERESNQLLSLGLLTVVLLADRTTVRYSIYCGLGSLGSWIRIPVVRCLASFIIISTTNRGGIHSFSRVALSFIQLG